MDYPEHTTRCGSMYRQEHYLNRLPRIEEQTRALGWMTKEEKYFIDILRQVATTGEAVQPLSLIRL